MSKLYEGGKIKLEENKSIGNLFKLKHENEAIKDRIIRDMRTFFKQNMIIIDQ